MKSISAFLKNTKEKLRKASTQYYLDPMLNLKKVNLPLSKQPSIAKQEIYFLCRKISHYFPAPCPMNGKSSVS